MQMSQLLQAVYLTGLTLLLRTFSPSGASPDAKRLYDDLLKKSGYNKLIRPVWEHHRHPHRQTRPPTHADHRRGEYTCVTSLLAIIGKQV